MMKFKVADEPWNFDRDVRQPGLSSIEELIGNHPSIPRSGPRLKKIYTEKSLIPGKEFPPHWVLCIPDLLEKYNRICQYSCFYIPPVTGNPSVDHLFPKSQNWDKVYEWSNYRLAAASVNSKKNKFTDVFDPFDVEDHWFAIEFVGCQVVAGNGIDEPFLSQINKSVERLGLNSFAMRNKRYDLLEQYKSGKISKEALYEFAPFLAREFFNYSKKEQEESGLVSADVRCPLCYFKGRHLEKICDFCDGKGTVSRDKLEKFSKSDYEIVKCPQCLVMSNRKCDACEGRGVIYRKYAKNSSY